MAILSRGEGVFMAMLSSGEGVKLDPVLVEEGKIALSAHCRHYSMPKRNIDMQDVENVLLTGKILREPEWDDQNKNWKYRVEGVDLDGDALTAIVVIFQEEQTIKVLTVF